MLLTIREEKMAMLLSVKPSAASASAWRMQLSGLCAILVGIGLSRFAYTPLLPELIAAHWFAPSEAAYLGAANLAGYLAGALLEQRISQSRSTAFVLRASMAAAAAAFVASAFPLSFAWFFFWRFLSGFLGGILMVLVAPTVLPHITPAQRGLAAGVIFTGVGCGIVASGVLVPALLHYGLAGTWLGLGALSLVLTAVAWSGWPSSGSLEAVDTAKPKKAALPRSRPLTALYVQYGLNAIGLVPHMIFLADYVARGLGQGRAAGAEYWVLLGIGALAGPILSGFASDRIGVRPALRAAFLLQTASVGVLAVTSAAWALAISSLVVGAFIPGISALTFSRVRELAFGDAKHQKAAWSFCTIVWAIGQAAGAYGFSYIFASTGGGYSLLFATGAAAIALAFAIEIAPSARLRK
jgi:predicted MFS family arabinose efflux permease